MNHFYHCYAAGNWAQALTEHCNALTRYGLYDELESFQVGFVGSDEQVKAARCTLDVLTPNYQVCAQAETGWEQVTLQPMYEFAQDHTGPISYAHTKGSSRNAPIDLPWRRMMTYHNFVEWRKPVEAVQAGDVIAGCYWLNGATPDGAGVKWVNGRIPLVTEVKPGGIFGGNFWWTTCELLRRNFPPDNTSRFEAEHWLGQLIPIAGAEVHNMTSFPIGDNPPPF